MHRSEFAAENSDQSPAKNKHFSEMDSQRLDSKTADGSNEQRFSSSVEPLSIYQNNRNGSVLPTNGQARSQINRPMFHYGYSPAGRNGNADKAWGQNPNAIEGQFTASFMTKWNAATYGKTSSHSNQLAITNGSDSPMKLQSDDSEDDFNEGHFDELSECDPFNQLRRTLIANPKVRSQAKLQMHYSQAVPMSPYVYSQAVPTVADLKSIPVWRRILNASHSEGSSNASLMSTGWKSTTHGHEKTDGDQFTSTGGQSLSDGADSEQTFDELLKTESFNSMSVAQKVFMKAQKDRESERRQYLLMRNREMRPRPPLLSRYSPEVLSEIDADSKEPHPMFTSTPRKMLNFDTSSSLNKSQQPSSKEELNGNSPRRDTPLDSLREPTATTTTPIVDSARKDLSAFTATADEQKSPPPASVSTDTDRNAELQKPSTVNETQAESQPPKFIDSTTPTVSESIDAEKNSSPESPIDLDDSISVPATTASDALNEIIISEPSPSENCLNKPIGEEIFAKPQVPPVAFIQPTNIINEEIEERKISPLDSVKNFDNSSATTCVPASALIDHCYTISFIEEVTSPGSPAEFICPNGSIQQTIIWPPQTKEEICLSDSIANTPSASLSDVNEIFITVPADPSDKKRLPPTSSVISPNQKSSLEIPNFVKKLTPKPKSAAKAYNRKNKIAVQSNELIKMAPPVGSTIGVPANSLVPNQIISEQKRSNIPKNVQPIQMASKSSSNLPVKSETKPNPINPLKRKNPEILQSHAPAKAKPPMAQNGPKANFSAASLKRTNKENLPLHIPAKVQKMEKKAPLNLPDITIERVSNGQNAKNEAAIRGRKNSGVRSFLECIQSLQRNGVTVFKVPRKASTVQEELSQVRQKSSNQDIDKFMKALQKNNVSIKPVNKKISRN